MQWSADLWKWQILHHIGTRGNEGAGQGHLQGTTGRPQPETHQMTTRIQHYVWRHYLEARQNEDGFIHCSRNGTMLPATNPRNIMAERDFYKLPHITKADVNFLKVFIGSTGVAVLRGSHRNLVGELAYVARANELIQSSDRTSTVEKRYVQDVVIEIEEKLQGQIEQDALPLLEELRKKRSGFVIVDEMAITFFHFLAHQYFRTKRIRAAIAEEFSIIGPDHDWARLTNIVCHIGAVNVGASLFVDRNEFDIIFLDDRDDVGFITGDQPVVNLMGTGDSRKTTELALYYPLAPDLSCLVVPRERKLHSLDIHGAIVEELNDLVAWESSSFLVASSNGILERIGSRPSLTRPLGCRILDSLVKATRCSRFA